MSQLLKQTDFSSAGDVLYLSEELRDMHVIVQTSVNRWKFPAHRLVLASESPIFRAQLADENLNELVLTDVTPSTTELLLKYMYRGKLEVENWIETVDLLEAALKYQVQHLIEKCGKFLEEVLSLSNVCHIYEKATECNLNNLQDKCLKLILDAGFIVLRREAFETLKEQCVFLIVSSPELNIDSELVVFNALFRWARTECCRIGLPTTDAYVLGRIEPFLKHLCIDDMSDSDKSSLPPSILSCVQPNNRNRIGYWNPDSLKVHSKSIKFDPDRECLCHVGDSISAICFAVDTVVHLIGLKFFVATNTQTIDLHVTLKKESAPKMAMIGQTVHCSLSELNSPNSLHPIKVVLKQPAVLKPGEMYNIYVSDESMEAQFPQSRFSNSKLSVNSGILNVSVYDVLWGISGLTVI